MRILRAMVIGVALSAAFSARAQASDTIVLPHQGKVRILDRADVAVGQPAAGDVLEGQATFVPYEARLMRGWPVDAWLRFRVSAPNGGRWLLLLPETEWAEVFVPDGNGGYRRQLTGTNVAVNERPIPFAVPVVPIDPSVRGASTIYLHVRYHPDVPLAPALQDTTTFFEGTIAQRLVYGFFIGALVTIFVLACYVVAVLRYQATGIFALYLLAVIVNEAVTTGLGNQYIWPDVWVDTRLITILANTLGFLAFLAFLRVLLQTRTMVPVLDRLLLGLFATQVVLATLLYAFPFGINLVMPLVAVELAGSALIVTIGIVRARQGSQVAPFFTVAFVPVAVGTLANIGYDLFLPAGNWFWAANGVELGTMAECVMMSSIVLNRINLVHRERQSAKSELSRQGRRNQELRRMVLTDPLTGLANRLQFYEELGAAIDNAKALEKMVGVLYVDLDDFKQVNDQRGHLAGDDLLRDTAQGLLAAARERDLVARLGGDEFAVLLRDLPDGATLDNVRARIASSFDAQGTPVSVGASIFPRDGASADAVIDAADRSMYQTKQAHKKRGSKRDAAPT